MKTYEAKNIRNVVVLGHQGCGKTTFIETLAYVTGLVPTKGEVEKKTTLSDYTPDEQKRGSSIQTAVIPMEYNGTKINFIDVPGNDDFLSETLGSLSVVDGAILIVDSSVGVQVGTVKAWNQLKKHHVPTVVFLNKLDKEGADFDAVMASVKEKISKVAIPFTYPLGHLDEMDGYIDCIEFKAFKVNGKEEVATDIRDDKKAKAEEFHNAILEEVAKTDDALLDKFFLGEEFTPEEIATALKKGISSDEIIPVLVGSMAKNVGLKPVLELVSKYLPAFIEKGKVVGKDEGDKEVTRAIAEDAPMSAFVFKTIVDPYSGVINLVKVVSGVLRSGEEATINGSSQRISMLYAMSGKKLDTITELHVGDIGAITRLDGVSTGMTVSNSKAAINYAKVEFPSAVIFKAIELKNKNDESKVGPALAKIQSEDPCVEVKRNNETKQLLLGGVSNSHIDFVIEKLRNLYKIDVDVQPMKVVYRESIKKTAEGDGRYVKQSGGSGFYGVVKMRFEKAEESAFAEEVFGGAVPKNYFPAVEKGFFEALKSGPLAGFPVIGVKGVLVDGKYHPVDSNEQAFKMAAILAFKDAYDKCSPIILEPVMRIHVIVPVQYTGDVMSDLNTRRARIQNMEEKDGEQDIEALVPEAEIIDYASQLKSLTQASGYFTRDFESYEEVPEYLKDKVIKENKIEPNA